MPPSHGPTTTPHAALPVYKLHYDLLLCIFEMNADMFTDDCALETTCDTSQVCRAWRECLVSTPSLWGKLIDFDTHDFSVKAVLYWGKKILQRSSTSMLWIKATRPLTHYLSKEILAFFADLLDTHWNRIQRLVVRIDDFGKMPIENALIRSLYRPASCLEEFSVEVGDEGRCYRFEKEAPGPFFSDQAPALQKFNAYAYKFNRKAPWLNGLHTLHIRTKFETHEVMAVLGMSSNLKYLVIKHIEFHYGDTYFPSVHLPNLECIVLMANLTAACTLLDSIEMPAACSLQYETHGEPHHPYFTSNLTCLLETLSKHARRYFQVLTPTKISIISRGDYLAFSVAFHGQWQPFPREGIASVLSEFSLPQFSQVTTLNMGVRKRPRPEFMVPFIPCLASVTAIEIENDGLSFLQEVQDIFTQLDGDANIIFPALKTLRTEGTFCRSCDKTLAQFATSRERNGHPLSVLDLTKSPRTSPLPLELFEHINGLKLLWCFGRHLWDPLIDNWEYVCGSGQLITDTFANQPRRFQF